MTVIDRAVRLPRLAFLIAWDMEGLGAPHPIVGVNGLYMTERFRAEIQRRTLARLAELGLATACDLHPRLKGTLAAIAHAGRECYAWTNFAGGDAGAILVAGLGDDAIRLVTDGTTVSLDPIDGDLVAERFVETLPDVPGASLRPVAVTRADYGGDIVEPDPLAGQPEVTRLRELMRAGRDAVHQIFVGARDRAGRRHRSGPLSALDLTGHGRVLTFVDIGHDRQEVINLVSGTPAKIISTLNATLRKLPRST